MTQRASCVGSRGVRTRWRHQRSAARPSVTRCVTCQQWSNVPSSGAAQRCAREARAIMIARRRTRYQRTSTRHLWNLVFYYSKASRFNKALRRPDQILFFVRGVYQLQFITVRHLAPVNKALRRPDQILFFVARRGGWVTLRVLARYT